MPIVTACAARGCSTLTIGRYCVEHDVPRHAAAVTPAVPRELPVRQAAAPVRTAMRTTP
ncbi:MAG TPA: hypothetical protein VIA10_17080 [Gaiellaceae bacterium]|jgi:hypothetical protein